MALHSKIKRNRKKARVDFNGNPMIDLELQVAFLKKLGGQDFFVDLAEERGIEIKDGYELVTIDRMLTEMGL